MKYIKKKLSTNLVIICCFLLADSLTAGIMKKEPYSVPSEIKYKEYLNIAILPFAGKLSDERKYVKDLIRDYIGDTILLIKKIRFSSKFIDFKRNAFNSSGDILHEKKNSNLDRNIESDNSGFLHVKLIEREIIEKIFEDINSDDLKRIYNIKYQEPVDVAGLDIIITGETYQDRNNISAHIKIINNIYSRVFHIEKEGTFRDIDQLLKSISYEVIKSVMVYFSYLNVYCNEKEAVIYIDDRYFGRTDKTNIVLEPGSHKIAVSKENMSMKIFQLNLEARSSESLHVEFTDKDIYVRNSISISTEPEKAKVFLDSNFIGFSPVVKDDIGNGTYRLRVEKDGYITKYQTLEINPETKTKEIVITLEKGNSKDYYFKRTSVFNTLFKCSLWGAALSSASYIYFGMKIEDENAKLRGLSSQDINYSIKKNKIEDRKENYLLYRQISLYSIGAMIISTGIFYYFDKAQDDIAIAVYLPQRIYESMPLINYASRSLTERGIGLIFSISF